MWLQKKITILLKLDYYSILTRSIANDCSSYQNSCLLYKSSKIIFISFSKEWHGMVLLSSKLWYEEVIKIFIWKKKQKWKDWLGWVGDKFYIFTAFKKALKKMTKYFYKTALTSNIRMKWNTSGINTWEITKKYENIFSATVIRQGTAVQPTHADRPHAHTENKQSTLQSS